MLHFSFLILSFLLFPSVQILPTTLRQWPRIASSVEMSGAPLHAITCLSVPGRCVSMILHVAGLVDAFLCTITPWFSHPRCPAISSYLEGVSCFALATWGYCSWDLLHAAVPSSPTILAPLLSSFEPARRLNVICKRDIAQYTRRITTGTSGSRSSTLTEAATWVGTSPVGLRIAGPGAPCSSGSGQRERIYGWSPEKPGRLSEETAGWWRLGTTILVVKRLETIVAARERGNLLVGL